MSPVESELKLRFTDPELTEAILAWPLSKNLNCGLPRQEMLETTYYDTLNYNLLKSGLSYRIRNSRDGFIATIKADGLNDGGLHRRLEFNADLPISEPDIKPFLASDIGTRLSKALGNEKLHPISRTSFSRSILDLTAADGSQIELALDNGQIISGDKSLPILELELELKSGTCQSLINLGAQISKEFPFLIELDSKLARALALAELTGYFPKDAQSPDPITPDLKKEPAFSCISALLVHLVQVVINNHHAFLADPDSRLKLYQFRVSLRRLRAILSFSKPFISPEEWKERQNSLKEFGTELGKVRDLDALIESWQDMISSFSLVYKQITESPHPLIVLLEDVRKENVVKLHELLSKGQATPVLLGLWAGLLKEQTHLETGDRLGCFAKERCRDLIEKFVGFGDEVDINSSDSRSIHRLRIINKKIRYTLYSLSPVLNNRTSHLIECLKNLQNNLGAIRDAQLALFNSSLFVKPSSSRQMHHDTGLLTSWQISKALKAKKNFPALWRKTKKACRKWLAK